MPSAVANHRKGLLITAIGGLVLSFDIPLIRLAYGDPWPILMLRTATTFAAAFVIWGIWRAVSPNTPSLVPGWLGAIVAALYGVVRRAPLGGIIPARSLWIIFSDSSRSADALVTFQPASVSSPALLRSL